MQKTVPRHGKAIDLGEFEVRETVHVCAAGCRYGSGAMVTRRAVSLAERIMPGRVVAYDTMVRAQLERFYHHRQREEVREALLQQQPAIAIDAVKDYLTPDSQEPETSKENPCQFW